MTYDEYEYNLMQEQHDAQLLDEQMKLADEQQIERLEASDPSTDDGRWGGDHCIHGTYIGTPSGADYICGFCEDGLTRRVSRTVYEFGFGTPGAYYASDMWRGLGVTLSEDDLAQIFAGNGSRWQLEIIVRMVKLMTLVGSRDDFRLPWCWTVQSTGYWAEAE